MFIKRLLLMAFSCSFYLTAQDLPLRYEQRTREIERVSSELLSLESSSLDRLSTDELKELKDKTSVLKTELDSLTTGVRLSHEEDVLKTSTDLWQEAQDVLSPLIHSLKRISEKPRKIESLKNDIADLEQKVESLKLGLRDIDFFIETSPDEDHRRVLYESKSRVEELILAYESKIDLLNQDLESTIKRDKPFLYSTGQILSDFIKTKGKNLVYALLVVIFTLFSLMLVRQFVLRPIFSHDKLYYFGRPLIAIYSILMVIFSILAGLISLFMMNDWFLFILFSIVLGLMAWGFKHLLPEFFSAMRVIFQLGTIREGQRIIFDGCPWLVEKIGLKTTLVNSALDGGKIVVGVEKIRGYVSRPLVKEEPLFPTNTGDYVVLSDATYGRILAQTPEQVFIVQPGKTKRVYQLREFLSLSPKNISSGFELESIIGVDLSYQDKINNVVKAFIEGINSRLKDRKLDSKIQKDGLTVQYDKRSASSLDISARLRFNGSTASSYIELKRDLNAFMLEICTENGFKIPLNQMLIHSTSSK